MLFSVEQIYEDTKKVLSFIIPMLLEVLWKDYILHEYSNFQSTLKGESLNDSFIFERGKHIFHVRDESS